jgi:hypothetical protein
MVEIFAVNVAHALSVPRSHFCEREAVRPHEWGRGTLRACATGGLETDGMEGVALALPIS